MDPRPFQHAARAPATAYAPGAAAGLGGQSPLKKLSKLCVITDQGVSDAGVAAKVIDPLGDKVAFVDREVVPDADTAHVDGLAAKIKDGGIEAIVAVGGGIGIVTAPAQGRGEQLAEFVVIVDDQAVARHVSPSGGGSAAE